jgi:hypothetical protein
VAVFSPYTTWPPPHFETELEIMQHHLAAGDEVSFWGCNADLCRCDPNPHHLYPICLGCMSRRDRGLALLQPRVRAESFERLTGPDRQEIADLPSSFSSIPELRGFTVEDLDLGYGALSSVITLTRNPQPDLGRYARLIRGFMTACLTVYRSLCNRLAAGTVDRLYVVCGRLASLRAAFRASQRCGVECVVHDRGCSMEHCMWYVNAMPHDVRHGKELIREAWDSAGDPQRREEVASGFFDGRQRGQPDLDRPFIGAQRPDLLPSDWNPHKRNIAIFSSSEDEYASISDEWLGPIYENQTEGLRRIIESLAASPGDLHLYLRLHPNTPRLFVDSAAVRSLRAPFLTVIRPLDPTSSYALMSGAEKVLTFGSTIGIEASFWGRPSILAGQAPYRGLGSTYEPATHDELLSLVRSELRPNDRLGALMMGYYFATFGRRLEFYRPTGFSSGTFKGQRIEVAPWLRLPQMLYRAYRGVRARLTSR